MLDPDDKQSPAASPPKDFLQAILDTVVDGIIAIDRKGRIMSVNRAAEKVFGYQAKELVGRNVSVLMPEPYHSEHDQYLKNYHATGNAKVMGVPGRELQAKRKDGSVFPIELGISSMKIAEDELYVGIVRDITERKKAERLTEELTGVMHAVIDGLVTIDNRGCIQSFNPAAERIFGYRSDEVCGKNVKVLMPEPYHSEHDGYLSNYRHGGERKIIGIGREVAARRKDGSVFPMDLAVSEMEVSGKQMFVGIIRDITDRKEAEQERVRMIESLRVSNRELDDFAYIASHDLKEPLRGLTNNARFLEEDYGQKIEADGSKRLRRMRYLCGRMEALINDLLYFSRLGRQDLAIQKTDLNHMVSEICMMMETTLEEQHAEVVVAERLPQVVCDGVRVKEVFRNLITNAIKYNDAPRKKVEIGFLDEIDGKRNVFYVRDNGYGIDPSFHEDIFRMFKRLNNEEDESKGTGAGLTFVKKIVQRHKGEIWLESALGQGSCFYFTLCESAQARSSRERSEK
ncbi:PAS domain S-box protein [Pelagicoccus sp. SDUM812003]|uniref:PAS domain S-box protein n=1 Tax=Pelagicoccus sp. SDUM812003 TaxID=3041267 RepID=UPI00280FC9A9|nr:PAS domain S-box protein [Pelagicoccus sp. SDUM812003]MDQ8202103.1 PAS domain S-box protein [Pelagicoccus sp. SDUM812003]